MTKHDISLLSFSQFPPLLREIPDPPRQLYLRGKLPDTNKIFLTVVGSRKSTSYGRETCRQLIRGLKDKPVCIVSGLALGIDALAHQTALEVGLSTLAVPGSGLQDNVIAPASNRRLAFEILNQGGGLLSELSPKQPAEKWTFPSRNRIMAGLAQLVLVIEAGERSGTLITARLAAEYNRDVGAVPGSIREPQSTGTNSLIAEGAYPIISQQYLLQLLDLEDTASSTDNDIPPDLSPEEQEVLKQLEKPQNREELVEKVSISFTQLQITLTKLEMKGLANESDGKWSAR